jgi:hypothetical protein
MAEFFECVAQSTSSPAKQEASNKRSSACLVSKGVAPLEIVSSFVFLASDDSGDIAGIDFF